MRVERGRMRDDERSDSRTGGVRERRAAMRVKIYSPGRTIRIVEDVEFITHKNAVEGLVLHESETPDVTVEVQAQPGQAFVQWDLGFLRCYQAGHFVLDATDAVVGGGP